MELLFYYLDSCIWVATFVIGILLIIPKTDKYGIKKKTPISKFIGKLITFGSIIMLLFKAGANYAESSLFVKYNDRCYYRFMIPTSYQDNTPNIINDQDTCNVVEDCTYKIPFKQSHGVYYINVDVEGYTMKTMFDTGCGYQMAISSNDFYNLVEKGVLNEDDLKYGGESETANGNQKTWVITIPKITIGKMTFFNVECGVSENLGTALIGGSILKDYSGYYINTKDNTITIKK